MKNAGLPHITPTLTWMVLSNLYGKTANYQLIPLSHAGD